MITPAQMYWLTRLDALNNLFVFMCVQPVILAGICLVCLPILIEGSKDHPFNRFVRKMLCPAILLSFLGVLCMSLVPSTREMAAILVIPKIANSEKVQAVGGKIYDLATEWLEALKPSKKKAE